jgi:CRISPR-associated endonuclease Csn1
MKLEKGKARATILGLDMGSNSLGWAIIETDTNNNPKSLLNAGVRVFKAGLDDLETDGLGKSRNLARREARGRRRLLRRHRQRLIELGISLQKHGLISNTFNFENDDERHNFFLNLDKKIESPYSLRAKALDHKLELLELGRVLYHLCQKRGFLSNRKSAPKDEDSKKGVVKTSISNLEKDIAESGSRTLGEYLASLDKDKKRIRGFYTSRKMYENEFELIWNKQADYYPEILTNELKKQIHHSIFYQRPLKSRSHLIGECELEPGHKRAPICLLISQRFRYLQTVNNLRVLEVNGFKERELTGAEREKIINILEYKGKVTFATIRKELKLPKGTKLNLEAGDAKETRGNSTTEKMVAIFGLDQWKAFSDIQQDKIIEEWRSIVKDDTLKRRAIKLWALSEEKATEFSQLNLEEGYIGFSKKAIAKLMPFLEKGISLQTAIQECYPERFKKELEPVSQLPPIDKSGLGELRNPIVGRSLTELRHLVNTVIKEYGKPDIIRIELARELRQTPKQREETIKKNRGNEKARKEAADLLLKEAGITEPKNSDIIKAQLWIECGQRCPYTGQQISAEALFGEHPQFDVEHIIPYERSLDDSFVNKTLCYADENRRVKHKKTPYEAYHGTPKGDEILSRVEAFNSRLAKEKYRRFCMTPDEVDALCEDFTARQLNDTRWTSKWAKRYLGLLYGGTNEMGIDNQGKLKVQAVTGQITAKLRYAWGLNDILGNDNTKSRDDHRHHAIDAITIALTTPGMVKELSLAAQRASNNIGRLAKDMVRPWDLFYRDVENKVKEIVVSHRLERRVRGALHQESYYGQNKDSEGKPYICIRKPIGALSENDVDNIVHATIRKIVRDKLREIGKPPKDAFKDESNWPKDSQGNRIRRVRIKVGGSEVFRLKHGFVRSDTNHHMAIFKDDKTGKWDCEVVSLYEAYQRLTNNQPIVRRDFGEGKTFVCSLAKGDIISLKDKSTHQYGLFVVRKLEKPRNIQFSPINDARQLIKIPRKGYTATADVLKKIDFKKMLVTPLGEVRYAND